MLSSLLLCAALAAPAPARAASAADEPPPAAAPDQAKEERLKKLAALLRSFSDDDYDKALKQLPPTQRGPRLASRSTALKSAYSTLAALEYKQADDDAKLAAVDAGSLQETGWATDLLKFLGNAAINYALQGGQVYVGRELKSDEQRSVDGLEKQLASADVPAQKKTELHDQLGGAYQRLAESSAKSESPEERAARKKARVRQLADLLQSTSDDEYQAALQQLHGKSKLGSRTEILHSAYVTLAALEYRDAAKKTPENAGAPYSEAYHRVARDQAKALAVNPDTLQETGWAQDLLDLAEIGGLGYLIYENERNGGGSAPAPDADDADQDRQSYLPARCPPGTTLENGACLAEISCPPGSTLTGGRCVAQLTCPSGSRLENGSCVAAIACPPGSRLSGGQCFADVVCDDGSQPVNGQCVGKLVCPGGTAMVNGTCQAELACPSGATLVGTRCIEPIACPAGTQNVDGQCQGQTTCPSGARLIGGRCQAPFACPTGYATVGAVAQCRPIDPLPPPVKPGPPIGLHPCPQSVGGCTGPGMPHPIITHPVAPGPVPAPRPAPVVTYHPPMPIRTPGPGGWGGWRCPRGMECFAGGRGGRRRYTVHAGRPVELYKSLDQVETEAAAAAPEQEAALHFKLGAIYEQLAMASTEDKPKTREPETPVPPPTQAPAPKQKPAPKAEEPSAPSEEDTMKEMEDTRKQMEKEVERRSSQGQ